MSAENREQKYRIKIFIYKVIWIFAAAGMIAFTPVSVACAADSAQLSEFSAELKKMIMTGDTSTHNILKYKLSNTQKDAVWKDLITDDCMVIYRSSLAVYTSTTTQNGILQTITLKNIDSDYMDRYKKTLAAIKIIRSGIDENMLDVEKVLYVHDYIVTNTSFSDKGTISYVASGPLVYEYGVCSGYTQALWIVLSLENIECTYMTSTSMNHTWLYAKLDGEWYHIDSLWDETVIGEVKHTFLLRNDNEFTTSNVRKHYDWYTAYTKEISTSKKYSDWFVHNVVGKMFYYKRLWYYTDADNTSILSSDIEGNHIETVVDGADFTVNIKSIVDGILYYTYNNKSRTINLDNTQTSANPNTKYSNADGFDLKSFDNWRSGSYDYKTGLFKTSVHRICSKDYVKCEKSTKYIIKYSDQHYRLIIREMNKDNKFIKSNNLKNGDYFKTTNKTAYLGIVLYSPKNKKIRYADYKALFKNGFKMSIKVK